MADSSNTLIDSIYLQLHEYDIVSFDVFDTLLFRNVAKPTDIFRVVELEYNRTFGAPVSFCNLRVKAEQKARTSTSEEDIELDEIYQYIQLQLGEEVAEKLKQLEIETEKLFIVINPELKKLYDTAKKLGKKIFLISDMYLSESIIRDLLVLNGISGYDGLFVSGERKASKATGNMYTYIRKSQNIDESVRWLHIGDNEISDYTIPRRHGIDSHLYKKNARTGAALKNVKLIGDSILYALQKNAAYDIKDEGYWYQFGFNISGPLYAGLLFWLADQVRGKDNIFFMARDGYLAYKLYNIMKEHVSDLPEAYYLLASRRAYIYSQIADGDRTYSLDILTAYNSVLGQQLSVGEILDNIGLEHKPYLDKLASFGLNIDSNVNSESISKIKAFLEGIWHDIAQVLKTERQALLKYLVSMKIGEYDHIHIFDIGWRGSSHLALQELINKPVHGYYFGTAENIFDAIKNRSVGYMFDQGRPRKYKKEIFDHIMIFEFIFSGPHGSLIKFVEDKENQMVLPVFRDVEQNSQIYEAIRQMHRGIIDLFKQALKYSKYMEISKEYSFDALHRFISEYNVTDLIQFSSLTNSVGIGESKDIKRYVTCYEIEDYLSNRKLYDREAASNLWKNAILIRDKQGRYFNQEEIRKLYGLRKERPHFDYKKYWRLFGKAIKNPRKAVKKIISMIR
jgi:predicted HAD superfamily hydrolase